MNKTRRTWFKNLRKLRRAPDRIAAFEALNQYTKFMWDNDPPGVVYQAFIFLFCLVFRRHAMEHHLVCHAARDMMVYALRLEEAYARLEAENKTLLDNQRHQRLTRKRYDALRRERRVLKHFKIADIDRN